MTWNPEAIGTRRVRSGRDRRIDVHEQLRVLTRQPWFATVVAELDAQRPHKATGRPRRHSHAALLLLQFAALLLGSQRDAQTFLATFNRWEGFRRDLARHFPDDPCLRPGTPAPSKSALGYLRRSLTADHVALIASHVEHHALAAAAELGLGVNTGTMLEPSRQALLFGDGLVVRSMTRFTPADTAVHPDTGEIQARRHDPDASWHTTGDHRRVFGTHFAHLSGFTGEAGEHVVFGVRPVLTGGPTEADAALDLARHVTGRLPGFAALTWDKAVRSHHVDALWDLRLQPVIGVHDKTGRHTDHFPLDEHTVNGITVRLVAHKGAVCLPTLTGSVTPLEPVQLHYQANRRTGQRAYGTFRIPEGTDCDTRLWGATVRQRLNSRDRSDTVWGEHVRALTPGSDQWRHLYGNRSLAESTNSWLQSHFQSKSRARSLGRTLQWLDLVLLAAVRNTQSLVHHRRRLATGTAAANAPPAA